MPNLLVDGIQAVQLPNGLPRAPEGPPLWVAYRADRRSAVRCRATRLLLCQNICIAAASRLVSCLAVSSPELVGKAVYRITREDFRLATRGLDRRLTFYAWESAHEQHPFDRLAAASTLKALPDTSERKYRLGDFSSDVLLVKVGTEEEPTQVIVLRLRPFDDRPYVRAPGEKPAPVGMKPSQDILDVSHGVIWRDGYAAFAQGGHAPPPSHLSEFLLAHTAQAVVFEPLFDRTLVERLKALEGIRAVDLRIRNAASVQEQADAALGPFSGLAHRFGGNTQEVVVTQSIKVPHRGRGARSRVLDNVTPADVIQMAAQADALCDYFTVTGITKGGRVQHIDLLNERLHIPVRLPRASGGGHYPDDDATFSALFAARKDLEEDGRLEQATRSKSPGLKP